MSRRAIIIGAGPAGLTAAAELLARTDVQPVVIEAGDQAGGLSRTVVYKGNRMDIGGHRFFSKSDAVMAWWLRYLPLASGAESEAYRQELGGILPEARGEGDAVMLVRQRRSRICYRGEFFEYPVRLSSDTLRHLGLWKIIRIGFSYVRRVLFPIKPVVNLEEFFINQFGDELYRTFFKDYSEKVWGVPCASMSAAWGAQRIKDMSVGRALGHWLWTRLRRARGVRQQGVSTSLIERFLYPRLGPGQLWESVARSVRERGGEVRFGWVAESLTLGEDGNVREVHVRDVKTGEMEKLTGDFVLSSMPVQNLVRALGAIVPEPVRKVGEGLQYRDFITVGVLVKKVGYDPECPVGVLPSDNWLYIQEPGVKLARVQIFNNWSPAMTDRTDAVWLGLEYFCTEGDALWRLSDAEMLDLAVRELGQVRIAQPEDVLDGTVLRVEKAYPGYFAAYEQFNVVRAYLDAIPNLFLIGRNGMHKYNNQDHSMLTAMEAVRCIESGITTKDTIWPVNTEESYHERR